MCLTWAAGLPAESAESPLYSWPVAGEVTTHNARPNGGQNTDARGGGDVAEGASLSQLCRVHHCPERESK